MIYVVLRTVYSDNSEPHTEVVHPAFTSYASADAKIKESLNTDTDLCEEDDEYTLSYHEFSLNDQSLTIIYDIEELEIEESKEEQ